MSWRIEMDCSLIRMTKNSITSFYSYILSYFNVSTYKFHVCYLLINRFSLLRSSFFGNIHFHVRKIMATVDLNMASDTFPFFRL